MTHGVGLIEWLMFIDKSGVNGIAGRKSLMAILHEMLMMHVRWGHVSFGHL